MISKKELTHSNVINLCKRRPLLDKNISVLKQKMIVLQLVLAQTELFIASMHFVAVFAPYTRQMCEICLNHVLIDSSHIHYHNSLITLASVA